ncbi:MAG: hypothetical protein IKY16_02765 [Bacteroidales bacterium]|nr:hypothetical protein [Bacteroidales bacterium]
MENTFTIGKRVRVSELIDSQCNRGGQKPKTHYGRIEDIVRDMFDGSDLYLVNVLGEVKTYKAESLLLLKKDRNKDHTMKK